MTLLFQSGGYIMRKMKLMLLTFAVAIVAMLIYTGSAECA